MQRNQAGYATLVAEVAGVVTGIEAEPGQGVAAGAPAACPPIGGAIAVSS